MSWIEAARQHVPEARRYAPVVDWLPRYERTWLSRDLLAAAIVWALLVPQALAYGSLAGLPPQYGLYAAAAPLLLYAVFGTSRQLSVGPGSAVAILVAATVAPLAMGDGKRYLALSAALALLVGGILVAAGLARLGFVSEFFARPVLSGFVSGLALVIIVGQLPKLFGVDVEDGNFFEEAFRLAAELDQTDLATLGVGLGSLILLVVLNRFAPRRTPGALITLALAIVVVSGLDLADEGVAVVGEIDTGLPRPEVPTVGLGDVVELLPGAVAIALVAFAESIATARSLAAKHGYEVDANQELLALGTSNVGTGFFQGFAVDGSLSRSAAADDAGQRSQVASLVNLGLVLLTIALLLPLFENLPDAALAAIIIVAVAKLVDIGELRRLFRLDRADFALALLAFLGVLLFGTLAGIAIAVIASLLALTYRAYRPRSAVLGRAPDVAERDDEFRYRDISRHPEYETFPGLVIFRFGNELFFANAGFFRQQIRRLVREADPPARAVLVDSAAISYIDTTAQAMLKDLVLELAESGVRLGLARVTGPAHDILRRSGLEELVGPENLYATVRAGVADYLRRSR